MIRLSGPSRKHERSNALALNEFTTSLIHRKVRRLVHCRGFGAADREDLEQELWVRVWEASARFDPQRSHPNAYVSTVVERAAATLARDQKAVKRGNYMARRPLAVPTVRDDNHERAAEHLASTPSHEAVCDLVSDVAGVLMHLPEELREVASRLGNDSKRSIARSLGISRRLLNRRIDALRDYFIAAGLDEDS